MGIETTARPRTKSTPPTPFTETTTRPQSERKELVDAFRLLEKWEPRLFLTHASAGISDLLVRDPIRWINDDYGALYHLIQKELFTLEGEGATFKATPHLDMVLIGRHLLKTSPSFFTEDAMNLAIVLARIAAQRVFVARAILLEKADIA